MNTFISFDIDGTLIKFGGESVKHPIAVRDAFNELLKLKIKEYPEKFIAKQSDGWTDSQLCREMLKSAKITPSHDLLLNFQKKTEDIYYSIIKPNFNIVPGAHKFLSYLSQKPNIVLGIATGNFEKIAWKKIQLSNLEKYFSHHIGGFGNSLTRKEILQNALKDAITKGFGPFQRMIHVGDTKSDAVAAFECGFESIIMKTGRQKDGFPKYAKIFNDFETDFQKLIDYIK
ncbi:haloacid dehalogenase-like hydrolase family protein [Tritrichomonas foetus]|uniref:Haloacid dehalogenase-like hydrolase family protein n=1 Tax=Tritrichomonas foetus TaxID=1144522 RepID=A0A1J4KXZ8_9EUKA|nr:haloacid dehalogenase-like hydrolase family protein [Tritrichomonas foetus]|eukprot:OHT14572.1 haloacid dehalogenase-like hydrolase family protein [Tritrichomonas foetus]